MQEYITKAVPEKKQKKKREAVLNKSLNRWGWAFIAIGSLLIILFVFIPMIQALWLSLHSGAGTNTKFSGISNYTRMFTDTTFIKALGNTFIFLIVQVPIMIILALFISVLLNDKKLKCRSFFRIAVFIPCVTSLVSYSLIMKSIFAGDGLVNQLLMNLHLISEPIGWTTDPLFAKSLIIISITWRWTGYNMIFYLSGLQNIDPSIYEAADLDGCNAWQKFFKVTVPQLKPIILFTTITSTIGTLQLFDEVRNITDGGPANATVTISQYIYNLCFKYSPNFGYAAAVSFVVLIIIGILSVIQMKVGGDD